MKHPHVEAALGYAKRVVAGKIPACQWVKYACRRHLTDLKRTSKKDFLFRFDPAKAERACRFAEKFPHVKGHWAIPAPGGSNRLELQPWQSFLLACLFGWVEKGSGLRRFRTAYIEVPRKNGKSQLAAIIGLYFLSADGEYGAEVYSGAVSEKQAWEVFRPAKQMAERTPAFLEDMSVEVNAKSLTVLATGGRFEPIIGKPGDGASPSCSITDEYHEHPDSTQFDTMVTGMGARLQPLALVITTSGASIDGPCYQLHERVQKMLDGTQPDDRLLGVIYTLDAEDDWTKPEALIKANPNYGVSVSADFLLNQQRVAISDSREQNVFKNKHLDIWNTARAPWMNMQWWSRQVDRELREQDFEGERCFMAFDLANRLDIVAQGKLFRKVIEGVEHFYYFGRYYVPQARVDEPERKAYQGWVHDGHLIATEGNDCDLNKIVADVAEDRKRFNIRKAGFDPWNSIGLRDGLQKLGINCVEIPQQVQHFSEPMKAVEAAVKDGRFHHAGNPCMNWMVGNVTVKPDAKDNVFPRKERPDNKIDGPVSLFMLMKLAMATKHGSVYDTRGLITAGGSE